MCCGAVFLPPLQTSAQIAVVEPTGDENPPGVERCRGGESGAARQPERGTARHPLDVGKIRADFPILQRTVHGKQLIYLDNAATTQKPQTVISAVNDYYAQRNANILPLFPLFFRSNQF